MFVNLVLICVYSIMGECAIMILYVGDSGGCIGLIRVADLCWRLKYYKINSG